MTFRVVILLLLMAGSATRLHAEPKADSNAIHERPCTKAAADRMVTLEILPRPVRHMEELTFRVTVKPADNLPSTLVLDLSMPGMHMGKNQVRLEKSASGAWEGKGLIVRCMSGRKLWEAAILSPQLGNPAFSFDVRD